MTGWRRGALGVVVLVVALMLAAPSSALARGRDRDRPIGRVYVETNETTNAIAVFMRWPRGQLSSVATVPTGGSGTGAGLGSQGALARSADGRWLFAVNAGSNDVSVFAVSRWGLRLVDQVSSEGTKPVSVATWGRWVYVLNDGGSGDIAGFHLSRRGLLTFVSGSIQPLSNAGTGAAPTAQQIGIEPGGRVAVVTEQSTDMIDLYALTGGVAGPPTVVGSNGGGPYGFDFARRGALLVSEAASGSVTSYKVTTSTLTVVSPSVTDSGTAPCWVRVSPDGRYAYVSDAHSNDVSIYRVRRDGSVSVSAPAAVTVATPLDIDLPHDGRFVYVLSAGSGSVAAFRVGHGGSLHAIGSFGALPASAAGLIAW